MSRLTRTTIDGACNDPLPNNWSDACQLKPGHDGDHRWRKNYRRDWDFIWRDGVVWDGRSLDDRAYVRRNVAS